jgi:hypothetical protein
MEFETKHASSPIDMPILVVQSKVRMEIKAYIKVSRCCLKKTCSIECFYRTSKMIP